MLQWQWSSSQSWNDKSSYPFFGSRIARSYVTLYLIKVVDALFSVPTVVSFYISIIGVKGSKLITPLSTLVMLAAWLTTAITTGVSDILLCLDECLPHDEWCRTRPHAPINPCVCHLQRNGHSDFLSIFKLSFYLSCRISWTLGTNCLSVMQWSCQDSFVAS